MPNVVALASEYAPKRLQPILVTLIFVGMGGGAVLASLVGGALIPIWGWRSVFYVGGILPIALALLLIKLLPESVRFLTVRGGDPRPRAAPSCTASRRTSATRRSRRCRPIATPACAVKHLFTEGRAHGHAAALGALLHEPPDPVFHPELAPEPAPAGGHAGHRRHHRRALLQHRRHRRHDPAGSADERRSACSRRSSANSSPRSAS